MTEQIETALSEKGSFGMGNLRYAYILNALRDWAGDEAEIREVGCQFRAINQKNDVLTVTGMVKEKKVEDGENRVYLDVNVVNQSGSATCPGHAVVVLPAMRGESCAVPPPLRRHAGQARDGTTLA